MTAMIAKNRFLAGLRRGVREHCAWVTTTLAALDVAQLRWQPSTRDWSILHCFEHMNLTHDYYRPKIQQALAQPVTDQTDYTYTPSFWGRMYMHFAFNPRYSFAAPAGTVPSAPQRAVLADCLAHQGRLVGMLHAADKVDLRRTRVPISPGVAFNFGDCLRVLVQHDELHVAQARRVLEQQPIVIA